MKLVAVLFTILLGVGGGAASAHAGTLLPLTLPFTDAIVSPCTGAPVVFSGNLVLLIGLSVDADDSQDMQLQGNLQGINGVDGLTGRTYQVTGTFQNSTLAPALPIVHRLGRTASVVSPDHVDDFTFELNLNVSVSLTGEASASYTTGTTVCRS